MTAAPSVSPGRPAGGPVTIVHRDWLAPIENPFNTLYEIRLHPDPKTRRNL